VTPLHNVIWKRLLIIKKAIFAPIRRKRPENGHLEI
jgi:hypothetical protein